MSCEGRDRRNRSSELFRPFPEVRFITCSDIYSKDADDVDQIQGLERKLRIFFAHLTPCTSGDANNVV